MDQERNTYLIPASIVVAGVLVAFAVVYTGGVGITGSRYVKPADNLTGLPPTSPVAKNVKPVSATDRILGDPEAPVKIIEFSDLECPFCKQFHATMKQVMETYGKDGKVAWVYRHFPLDSIHPKARKEAEASECAAEQGGNEKFWAFVDRIFEITPSNNRLPPEKLPEVAGEIGLDVKKFEDCLASGSAADKVSSMLSDGQNAGAEGTPYSVLLGEKGLAYPVSGAYPFPQLKTIIDSALAGTLNK